MPTFTVHEQPQPPADRIDRAEALVFVKDGFTWSAALFAPIWLIVHRLWWPLLGYIILNALFELVRWGTNVDPGWVTLAGLALHVLLGFEAGTIRRWALERKGWHFVGSVSGRRTGECERRFFEEWLPGQPMIASQPASPKLPLGPSMRTTPVVGSLLGARS
jgi:hypothetical protein